MNNRPDLLNAIIPEEIAEKKKTPLVKSGVTRIVEVGRLNGNPRIVNTALGYQVCIIYLHVGATANHPSFSPQIEAWRITGEKRMAEAKETLKSGMVVAIEGERRTFLLKQRSQFDTFQHINVVGRISILDYRGGMKEAFRKEFAAYDNCYKNDGR